MKQRELWKEKAKVCVLVSPTVCQNQINAWNEYIAFCVLQGPTYLYLYLLLEQPYHDFPTSRITVIK